MMSRRKKPSHVDRIEGMSRKEARREINRINGLLGGRPRVPRSHEDQIKAAREVAARNGKLSVVANVQLLLDMRDNLIPGATATDRKDAAKTLLSRFGFPESQSFQGVEDDAPKLFEFKNYKAPDESYAEAETVVLGADVPAPETPH